MTVRFSTALREHILNSGGFNGAFNGGRILIFAGTQPASPDTAASTALLGTISLSSVAPVAETRASQTITVAGASGSINTVVVSTLNIIPDGAVNFRTDVNTTAADLCEAINRNGIMTATVAGAVVTVRPRAGAGTTYNGVAFATTVTTLTATVGAGTMSGGVAGTNGLKFGAPVSTSSATTISKLATQTWSFTGAGTGTAGYARFVGSATDDGQSTSTILPRLDGSIATSGGDFALSNISVVTGAPNTMDTFAVTFAM